MEIDEIRLALVCEDIERFRRNVKERAERRKESPRLPTRKMDAAIKRASLDLTRSLSKLRNG